MTETGTCSEAFDFQCHCKNIDDAWSGLVLCLRNSCSISDLQTTINVIVSRCGSVGVAVQVPEGLMGNATLSTFVSSPVATSTPTPASNTSSTLTSDPPEGTTTSTTGASNNTDTSSTTSLSAGAAAGVGVGVTFSVVAIGLGGFLLYRRRRNAKADTPIADTALPDSEEKGTVVYERVELPHESQVFHELDGVPRNEMEDVDGVRVARNRGGTVEADG